MIKSKNHQVGTTLIETLVAAAFFVVFSLAIYQLYAKVIEISARIRIKTIANQIASEQIEFIRNLQYSDVGIVSGIPLGVVPASKTISRAGVSFVVNTTIRNIDLPADGTLGGNPNDLSPADNKLVVIEVACVDCKSQTSIEYTTNVAPKSLETENGNGALVIKVIDASGLPVQNATIRIQNDTLNPAIDFTDITDSFGVLTIVDAPPSTESYHITVTKNGYSSEQTYVVGGVGNPNPTKPHITIVANTVSQGTFAIDQSSSIDLKGQSAQCSSITGESGNLVGSKIIGTNPDVIKNTIPFSLSSASNNIANIEWDTYNVELSGTSYDIAGTNPIFPLSISPGSSQQVTLTLKPATSGSRLVVAASDVAGLPVAGADVSVSGPSGTFTNQTSVGSVSQTSWIGGSGQDNYTDQAMFFSTDGGVDYSTNQGELELLLLGASYISSGELVSSSIDLGEASVFQQLSWSPINQPAQTGSQSVKFQIATNNDNATWDFLGPDGTDSSYYTNPTSDIADIHNGDRYVRYKAILSTDDTSFTPSISDIAITYTSGCLPPGQIDFSGLSSGSYTVTVSKSGYTTSEKTITIDSNTYETIQLNP